MIREPDYYVAAVAGAADGHPLLGFVIAALMALGAIFGARQHDVLRRRQPHARDRDAARARLRRSPVVVSVLAEAVLLSLVGGLIGGGLAWLAFDGYQTATMNWQSFSQVAFAFAVTPALLARGHVLRRRHGAARRPLPGVRAARMPVVTALRRALEASGSLLDASGPDNRPTATGSTAQPDDRTTAPPDNRLKSVGVVNQTTAPSNPYTPTSGVSGLDYQCLGWSKD